MRFWIIHQFIQFQNEWCWCCIFFQFVNWLNLHIISLQLFFNEIIEYFSFWLNVVDVLLKIILSSLWMKNEKVKNDDEKRKTSWRMMIASFAFLDHSRSMENNRFSKFEKFFFLLFSSSSSLYFLLISSLFFCFVVWTIWKSVEGSVSLLRTSTYLCRRN